MREVAAPRGGYVTAIGAVDVGLRRSGSAPAAWPRRTIDHAVGVVCLGKRGDSVESGEPIAEVHARDDTAATAGVQEVLAAYEIGDERAARAPIVLETIG